MVIEIKCPCCGGKVISPDPPTVRTTKEERVAFEKWWDTKYAEYVASKEVQ
jgi:hypothetical protein